MGGGRNRRFSYTDQKIRQRKAFRVVLVLLSLYVAYSIITGIFLEPIAIRSSSMAPGLKPGDRVFVSPVALGARTIFSAKPLPGIRKPKRGDLVLVEPPYAPVQGFFPGIADRFIRFMSAQLLGLPSAGPGGPVIKRVVGLPGDKLEMRKFVALIRPKGQDHSLTEDELASRPYDASVPVLPAGWDGNLPFSGDSGEVLLGDDEYFVLSDDRGSFHDSRSWGPVRLESILGLVVLRYWPIGSR
jgi:signal peptidase I